MVSIPHDKSSGELSPERLRNHDSGQAALPVSHHRQMDDRVGALFTVRPRTCDHLPRCPLEVRALVHVLKGDGHIVRKASDTVLPLAPPAPLATVPLLAGFHIWNVQPMPLLGAPSSTIYSRHLVPQVAPPPGMLTHRRANFFLRPILPRWRAGSESEASPVACRSRLVKGN